MESNWETKQEDLLNYFSNVKYGATVPRYSDDIVTFAQMIQIEQNKEIINLLKEINSSQK